jgi:hypothetical protein
MSETALSLIVGLVVGIGYGLCGIRSPGYRLVGTTRDAGGQTRGTVGLTPFRRPTLRNRARGGARTLIRRPDAPNTERVNRAGGEISLISIASQLHIIHSHHLRKFQRQAKDFRAGHVPCSSRGRDHMAITL